MMLNLSELGMESLRLVKHVKQDCRLGRWTPERPIFIEFDSFSSLTEGGVDRTPRKPSHT